MPPEGPAPSQPEESSRSESESALASLADGFDPLLDSLKAVLRHYGVRRSDALLRGALRPDQAKMTPRDAIHAASKAGFRARVLRRKADRLSRADCPCIVFLNDGTAAVLDDVRPDGVALAGYEGVPGPRHFATAEFAGLHTGFILVLRPEVGLTLERYAGTEIRRRSWFWAPILANWWTFFQVIVATVMVNLFALIMPFFVMIVYDRVIPNESLDTLWVLAIGMALLLSFDFLLKTLRARFVDAAARRADIKIGEQLFEQVLTVRMAAKPRSAGAFGSTLKEFESLREFFSSATLIAVIDLPFAFLFLFVLWAISGDVALVLFAAIPLVVLYGIIVQIPLHFSTRQYLKESHAKHGVLIETINALETVRGVGAERRMRQIWSDAVKAAAESSIRTKAWSASSVNVAAVVQQATSVGVVIFGVHMILAQELTMGGLIACVMLGGRALAPLAQVAQILTRFHQSRQGLKGLNEFMRQPTERPPEKSFVTKPVLDASVELREVSFRYGEEGDLVLKNVSLKIEPGERVGIIGRIGSGKSTLARLLLGLYEPSDGQILIGGIDIRQLDPGDLRRNIGYVPQEVLLFGGSVRENITASAVDADDTAILRAAEAAGLTEFLQSNPAGLDYEVGERGDGLSGGQRQAIAVARALIRDPGILLLDEPTSAMDARSEAEITKSIRAIGSVETILLITHRMSLLSAIDRLIVLDKGAIVADGPRDDVIRAISDGGLRGKGA